MARLASGSTVNANELFHEGNLTPEAIGALDLDGGTISGQLRVDSHMSVGGRLSVGTNATPFVAELVGDDGGGTITAQIRNDNTTSGTRSELQLINSTNNTPSDHRAHIVAERTNDGGAGATDVIFETSDGSDIYEHTRLHSDGGATMTGPVSAATPTLPEHLTTREWVEDNADTGDPNALHIDEFGADPTGNSPSDDAFEDAVDAADPGQRIMLTGGHYLFEGTHVIDKPLILDGDGSEIEATHTGAYDSDLNAVFSFRADRTTEVDSTATLDRGDQTIPVEDTGPFSVGDDVLIRDAGYLTRSYKPTRDVVSGVDSSAGEITIKSGAQYDYDSGAFVGRIEPLVGAEFRNMHFVGGEANIPLLSRFTRNTTYRNCTVDGYTRHGVVPWDDLNTKIIDCTIENPMSLEASHGEAIYIVGSTDITIDNPVIRTCRRGVDVRSGCQNLVVRNPTITDVVLHGFCYHNNGPDHVRGSMTVIGGVVRTREEDPDAPYQWGNGFNTSLLAREQKFIGTRFQAYNNGGDIYGANVVMDDCVVEPVDSRSGTELITIRDGAENIRVKNTHFDLTETSRSRGIYIRDGASDIRIEGSMSGNATQAGVRFDTCENVEVDLNMETAGTYSYFFPNGQSPTDVTLRGTIAGSVTGEVMSIEDGEDIKLRLDHVEASASTTSRAVRVYNADDVNIDGGYYKCPGRAILLSGGSDGFHVGNATVEANTGTQAIGTALLSGGTPSNVKIINNDLMNGSTQAIVFEGPVDGLWVGLNACSGVTPHGDSRVVYNQGNVEGDAGGSGGSGAGTIDVESFDGSDGDKVSAAIDAADPGDTLLFADRTYSLGSNYTIEKPLTLKGRNTRIEITSTGGTATFNFVGDGLGSTTSLSSAADSGATTLSVSSTSGFSAGDTVRVSDQEWANDEHKFDFANVLSAGSGEITLDRSIVYDYGSSDGRVAPVDLLEAPSVEGITFDCTGSSGSVLAFRWAKKPRFESSTVERYMTNSGWFHDCWQPVSEDVSVETALGTESGQGYAFIFYRCQDGVMRSPRAGLCRHGIDFSNGSHSCEVYNPVVGNAQLAGLHLHHDIGVDNKVFGGFVTANTGIAHRDNCQGFVVDGTTLNVRSGGINAREGFRGKNLEVNKIGSGSNAGITCYGPGNIEIEAEFHSKGGNTWNDGILLDSTSSQENITLDVDSDNAFGRFCRIAGGTISDLTIRGHNVGTESSGTGATGVTIHINGVTVNGFECSLKAYGWDDGIIGYSGATINDVAFSDCHIESGGDSVRMNASTNSGITAVGNRFPDGFSLGSATSSSTVVGNVGSVTVGGSGNHTDGNV